MKVITLVLPLFSLLNFIFLLQALHARKNRTARTYSYVGDDFPHEIPIPPLDDVEMTVEESLRFLSVPASNGSIAAWGRNVPPGLGYLRLGPNKRLFSVAMYHQLHCLLQLSYAIAQNRGGDAHLHHCLDYIRQNILCAADTTLEPKDFTRQNFTVDRVGTTRTCRDWSSVHKFAVENHLEWMDYRATHMKSFDIVN